MNDKRCFVDSNVWLYAFMQSESGKTTQAIEIISNPYVVLSTQVINEICVNLIKKAHYSELEIQQTVKNFYTHYQVTTIDEKLIIEASIMRTIYYLSYWDSLIVTAALIANCSILYSEDMQHNQVIQNIPIVNPFVEIK